MKTEPRGSGPDATPSSEPPRPARVSLAGKVTAAFFVSLVAATAVTAMVPLLPLDLPPWMSLLIGVLVGLPLGAWLIGRVLRPVRRTLAGLSDGIRSFRDRDFSVRLASQRRDELGELARLYNRVGEILQDERAAVRERELLLQTALNRSPAAILLINQRDRVIYSNLEARRLFLGGLKLEGYAFAEIEAGCPPAMREILASRTDGIFTVKHEERPETYHISQRHFQLNRKHHRLLLVRRLTSELGRQEAQIWKKVIRVISHELNNTLAPISSLVHSARLIAEERRHAERAEEVFGSIRERLDHLKRFIGGYARFARLPEPRKESIFWQDFLGTLEEHPSFELGGELPSRPGWFDPAQMRHVLINLLKNAIEASDGEPRIRLRIEVADDGSSYLQVTDRGRGMDEETMKKALLPFYSTKRSGTGLGLPLCREILEGHGGKLSLQARDGGGTRVTCWLPGPRHE